MQLNCAVREERILDEFNADSASTLLHSPNAVKDTIAVAFSILAQVLGLFKFLGNILFVVVFKLVGEISRTPLFVEDCGHSKF